MRTTVTIPDPLFERAKELQGKRSFSELVRQAVADFVEKAQKERLARQMSDGYEAEAENPSLDPAWTAIETEGW